MRLTKWQRFGVALVAVLIGSAGLLTPSAVAEDSQVDCDDSRNGNGNGEDRCRKKRDPNVCYPAGCPGPDARVTGIFKPADFFAGEWNQVRVRVCANGAGPDTTSLVRVTGRASPRTQLSPKKTEVFIGTGQPATENCANLFFAEKPKRPGTITNTFCAKATKDINNANNCQTSTGVAV